MVMIEERGRAYGFVDCNSNTAQLNRLIGTARVDLGLNDITINVGARVYPGNYQRDPE